MRITPGQVRSHYSRAWFGYQCGSRLLPCPGGAVPVAGVGHVPVPVAVRRVAVLAETGVIVEPGRGHLVIAQQWPERLGDPPGLPGLDRIVVAGGHAVADQVPLVGPTSSIRVAGAPQAAHSGVATIASTISGISWPRAWSRARIRARTRAASPNSWRARSAPTPQPSTAQPPRPPSRHPGRPGRHQARTPDGHRPPNPLSPGNAAPTPPRTSPAPGHRNSPRPAPQTGRTADPPRRPSARRCSRAITAGTLKSPHHRLLADAPAELILA